MGLLRHAPGTGDALEHRRWDVDVFLNDCAITGALEGTQRRLTDFLQAVDDQVTLKEAIVRSLRTGTELTRKRTAIISVPSILFIVDQEIAPTNAQSPLHVEKRAEDTMLNIGPFWIRGQVHVPQAGDLNHYIRGGAGAFIPVTDARISGHDQHTGRTILINRAHLRVLLV